MTLNSKTFENGPRGDVNDMRKSFIWKQVLSTAASCLTAMNSGLTCGITSPMLPQLRQDKTIHYIEHHESWIASITVMSMILGSLCSGPSLDRYGRKLSHILFGMPMVIGWIFIACANSTLIILFGRFITGISAGADRSIVMVYIGEITNPKVRAIALYAPSLLTTLGIWIGHIMGYYLGWRISSTVFAALSVLSFVAFLFMKESPLWLIAKGRIPEGVEAFRWFRGTDGISENELITVLDKYNENSKLSFREIFKVLCSRAFIKPILILFIIVANSQISGINVLTFYSQDIFEKVFAGNIDPFIMTMTMDGIRALVSLVICVVGRMVPKKFSCVIANFAVAMFAFGLVVCFAINVDKSVWIPVTCFVMYMIFSCLVVNTGWTFIPELMPTSARGVGSGLCFTFSFIFLFTMVKTLPDIIHTFGVTGLFSCFAISTLISGIVLCFFLPETNGKTLQSIENSYDKKNIELNSKKFSNSSL